MNKQEAADHLGVSVRTLQRLTSQGKIAARTERGKTGLVTVYDADDLDRYKRESEEDATRYVRPSVAPGTAGAASGEQQTGLQLASAARSEALAELIAAIEQTRAASAPAVAVADKLMLTLSEAAQFAGLSRGHLRPAIEEGKLKARIIGRGFKVKRADLDVYVKKL